MLTPSFHTIYRQGRLRAKLIPGSSEAIEQKERFTVACLASVLHHDPNFRRGFLHRVCGLDEAVDATQFSVGVEKANCGDLILVNDVQRIVFVLECKIGAKLQSNQDPTSEEFWLSGYGMGIRSAYQDTSDSTWERHYLILEQFDRAIIYPQNPWVRCRAVRWDLLTRNRRSDAMDSSLVEDLFTTFAELQIYCFAAWNSRIRNMKLAQHYFYACQIKEVLQSTASELRILFGLRTETCDDSDVQTPSNSFIGRTLTCKAAPEEWLKITGLVVEGPTTPLGWYGYAWGRLQVGLYVSPAAVSKAHATFKAIARLPNEETGAAGEYVHISSNGEHPGDREWLIDVFSRLQSKVVEDTK